MPIKTVFETLNQAYDFLKSKNIREYKLDAQILLSDVLNIKQSNLVFFRQQNLNSKQSLKFQKYILRRSKREPVSYILGYCEFMGLKFKVNKNVLIPRQETELLTQAVLEIGKSCNKKNILDLCCGSGAISISLSKLGSFNKITACDISLKAIDIAKKNALLNKAKNISFIQSDLFSSLKSRRFDIIVSNPPYISPQEFKNLEPELNFEPKKSLVAKDKGLYFYKQIAELAPKYLNPNAFVLLELNSNLSNQIKEIFEKRNYKNIEIQKDYSNLDRILKCSI